MVVRRIREHVATHNWFAVAIDLGIVVVGVIIATQVNNWNEARLDHARARSYHARLIEDLRATERAARASIAYYGDVRAHALATLDGLERPARDVGTPFLVDAYQATQIWVRSGKHSTYDEILSAGNAELIGTPDLRERIANFYWRMDGLMAVSGSVLPYRTRIRGLLPYPVQARIRTHCDEILTDVGKGLVLPRLPPACPITLPRDEMQKAVSVLRSAPGLTWDLTALLIDLDTKILNFGKLEASTREMRGQMEHANR